MQKALSVKTPFTTTNKHYDQTSKSDMLLRPSGLARQSTMGWDTPEVNPETLKFQQENKELVQFQINKAKVIQEEIENLIELLPAKKKWVEDEN